MPLATCIATRTASVLINHWSRKRLSRGGIGGKGSMINGPRSNDQHRANAENCLPLRHWSFSLTVFFPWWNFSLSSNAAHRPVGGDKLRLADVVAGFLLPDHFLEK